MKPTLRVPVQYEHTGVRTALPMMCDIYRAKDRVDTVYVAYKVRKQHGG